MQDVMFFINNNLVLCIAWVAILLLLVLVEIKERRFGPNSLAINDLTRLVNQENAVLIDIREAGDYNTGHISNAENFVPSKINDTNVLIKRLESKKDLPIILVCKDGIQSKQLAFKLKSSGIEKINFLNGGMTTWKSEGMPTI